MHLHLRAVECTRCLREQRERPGGELVLVPVAEECNGAHARVDGVAAVQRRVGRVNLITGDAIGWEGGVLTLALEDGRRIAVNTPAAPKPGKVTVAVRPEELVVGAADSTMNGSNTVDANVHAVAFLGDRYQYELAAGPLALLAQASRAFDGSQVKVHIPADACTIVE